MPGTQPVTDAMRDLMNLHCREYQAGDLFGRGQDLSAEINQAVSTLQTDTPPRDRMGHEGNGFSVRASSAPFSVAATNQRTKRFIHQQDIR
jgi:hypothetical protein